MERVTGIEPAWPAWKTGIMNLSLSVRPAACEARALGRFALVDARLYACAHRPAPCR